MELLAEQRPYPIAQPVKHINAFQSYQEEEDIAILVASSRRIVLDCKQDAY